LINLVASAASSGAGFRPSDFGICEQATLFMDRIGGLQFFKGEEHG
jgi:hypothetical protein